MSYRWRRGEQVTVLAEAYARSKSINRVHGRSYYLATRLLPAAKRPHVHALYGFMRRADDIVDNTGPPEAIVTQVAALDRRYRALAKARILPDLPPGAK